MANARTGASFASWVFFDYAQAIQLLNRLLGVRPDDVYGNLFRGSSRLLRGVTRAEGVADLERAIALAPQSADVRFEGKLPPASALLNEGGNMFPSQALTNDIAGIALANKEFHKENLCA